MKIPASVNGETVCIVAIDSRNPATAIVIRPNGRFGITELHNLTVLPYDADAFTGGSFVPPAPDAD